MAEAVELAYYYLDDWPATAFDWLGISIGSEGSLSSRSWGHETVVHRGVTQAELVDIFKKEGRYQFDDNTGLYIPS